MCPACLAEIAQFAAAATAVAGSATTLIVKTVRQTTRRVAPGSRAQIAEEDMALPKIVNREQWLAARKALLVREKEATRQRDALSAARRMLPMVEVHKEYGFDGANGRTSLRDLFDGRSQLIVYHFMFDPEWDEGCKSCSHFMDNAA